MIVLAIVLLTGLAAAAFVVTFSVVLGRREAVLERRLAGYELVPAGDAKLAPLIAMTAPSRPHVYFAWAPERSPWATADDLRAHGGLLVWPATDNAGTPPAAIKTQFPEMVPEVPRSFARNVQGFLPLIRVGWAMLRPPAAPAQQ